MDGYAIVTEINGGAYAVIANDSKNRAHTLKVSNPPD